MKPRDAPAVSPEAGEQEGVDARHGAGQPRPGSGGEAEAQKIAGPLTYIRNFFSRGGSSQRDRGQRASVEEAASKPNAPRAPEGWFSGVRFAAPFGRYESADEQEPPAHEVMVGRKGQRAFFLDLLFNSGRRGAFLVTGRRGSGKSSFVRHCLAEYEDEVYQRFLRSNVGRTLFWDRLLLAFIGLAMIFVALLLTDLLEVLGVAAQASADAAAGSALKPIPGKILLRLLGIPIIILCAYPWLYSKELFEVVFRARFEEPGRRNRRTALYATTLSVLLAITAFYLGPFGSPALGISRLMVVFTMAMFWVYATNFERVEQAPSGGEEGAHRAKPFASRSARFLRSPLTLLLPGLVYLWGGFGLFSSLANFRWPWAFLNDPSLRDPGVEFTGDLGLALSLAGGAALLRSLYLCYNPAFKKDAIPLVEGAKAYLLVGLVQLGFGQLLLILARPETADLFFSLLLVAGYSTWFRLQRGSADSRRLIFRPRPLVVLAAKAGLLTVLTVQLLHPLLCDDNLAQRALQKVAGRQIAQVQQFASNLYPDPRTSFSRGMRSPYPQAFLATFGDSLTPGSMGPQPNAKSDPGAARLSAAAGGPAGSPAASAGPDSKALPPRYPEPDHEGLFSGTAEEVRWVFAVFLFGLLLYHCEYEWIVRPFHRHRVDRAFDPKAPAPYEDAPAHAHKPETTYIYRMLARSTFFWTVHRAWSPLLASSVNLGFERLDHRRVVQAMLIDLRNQYNQKFVAWNSVIGNVIRIVKVLVLLLVVTMAGRHWFKVPDFDTLPKDRQAAICRGADDGYANVCASLKGHQGTGGAAAALCNLDPDSGIFHLAYLNLVVGLGGDRPPPYSKDNLLLGLLPYREYGYPPSPGPEEECAGAKHPLLRPGFEVRVYHLFLLGLFYLLSRWLPTRLPLPPYRQTLARIDAVLDGLSSRRSYTSKQSRWNPSHWMRGFFADEQVEQLDQEPVDPRVTEIAFLAILRDIRGSVLRLPGARHQVLSLPTPEVIFFFDELDKLGTRVDPATRALAPTPQGSEELDAERRRSLELHKLLADMKNMLSASEARFIFVGGRNLHDEWLADQTARQPLLTNIFNAEIYLPSLLTDYSRGEGWFLHLRIESYLGAQKQRADALYEQTAKTLWRPEVMINNLDRRSETFVRRARRSGPFPGEGESVSGPIGARSKDLKRNLNIQFLETASGAPVEPWGTEDLLTDLVFFLSWRSLGNAKRLKELLATFVRPASRVIPSEAVRWSKFDCRHVLAFRDIDRFRLQLIAGVYRHLSLHFEQSLINRDDKLAASTFYLADFLFKFHDRAFSWGNLERVDELVHIHRAPDMRQLLEGIVEKWSRWILHPIRNAMYGFRFRSGFAREISYLSRQCPEEMAAFNFTLDESQELKTLYALRIRRLAPDAHGELAELYAALGELHEFDQEFEDARLFYRRALNCLDNQHVHVLGDGGLLSTTSRHMELLTRAESGLESARQFMTWGVARLRLMMQIAMTFERSRDFERASLKYRDARSLSNALLVAMLDDEGRALFRGVIGHGREFEPQGNRLHTLKNLNIVFQPVFAEAWVAEKHEGGVDTGVALIETQVKFLRQVLPFVRSREARVAADVYDVHESNFALISSELHNKLGDMYFFRGKQPTTFRALDAMIGEFWDSAAPTPGEQPKKNRVGHEGYLLRSYYHYALGLHELRRYITYRRRSSKSKFNIMRAAVGDDYKLWETIDRLGWPDFVFRAVGESLNDLAEAALARISLYGLLRTELAPCPHAGREANAECKECAALKGADLFDELVDWLESREDDEGGAARPILLDAGSLRISAGTVEGWLGRWNGGAPDDSLLLDFDELEGHHDPQRLLMALELTHQSALYLEKGGYREEAAEEMLEICAVITRLIWWYVIVRVLVEPGARLIGEERLKGLALGGFKPLFDEEGMRNSDYWAYLLGRAAEAFAKADSLFRFDHRSTRFLRRRAERQEPADSAYLVGAIIPPRALTLICSLGAACSLAGEHLLGSSWSQGRKRLCELMGTWTGVSQAGSLESFLGTLRNALVRHPYPMLNRLEALKVLIDATSLRSAGARDPRADPGKVFLLEKEQLHEMLRYVQELQFLEAQYASPLHFTPLEMGVSLALVDLRCRASSAFAKSRGAATVLQGDEEQRCRLDEIRAEAKRYLEQSSETYTMRRAYYEGIQRLYYLYDDFNDRQIHFNLAMQMAGSEICLILHELLEVEPKDASGSAAVDSAAGKIA